MRGRSAGVPLSEGSRWFAVHTLPSREFGAAQQLAFQSFRIFLPLCPKTVRHARRFRTVQAPLFPRYLFVELDLGRDRWRSVNGTSGVAGLLMSGEFPEPVPRGIVESLQALSEPSGVIRFDTELRPGQSVKVLSGPFADMIGRLDMVDAAGRVRLLLQLMGAETPVWASAARVAPASVRSAA